MANELDVVKQLLTEAADQAGPLDASPDGITSLIRRRRRVRTWAVGLAVGCIAAGAVMTVRTADGPSSRSTDASVSSQPIGAPTAGNCTAESAQPGPPLGDLRSCQYIGLTLEAARALAATEHRDLVIRSQDGVDFPITYEFRVSRVCVTVVHNQVTSAFIG